jgi:hypothetical protein
MVLPVRTLLAVSVSSLALVPAGATPQDPTLADLLKRGAVHIATYGPRASGVVLEEQYQLTEISGGRALVPKRIASDLTFVDVNGETVVIRDVFAVDTKPTRERTPRLQALLNSLTQQNWQQAQEYARQSYYHFIGNIVLRGSDPALGFAFLSGNQPTLTYRLDGRKKVNGVAVAGVRFEEPTARDKVYLLGTPGNASGSGRFWIEPASGAIHQIELWLESPTESASVSLTFAVDQALGLILPKELSGRFEERELGAGPPTSATARTLTRRIEGLARYSNARR